MKIKGNRDKVRKEIDSKTCIDIYQYKAAYVECQFAKQESRSAAITRISLQAAFHKAAQQYELNNKLVRFALSRGFEMKDIRHCITLSDENDELE